MKDTNLIVIQSDEQRIGQKIYNFLQWLKETNRVKDEVGGVIADPFYLSDKKMMEYWSEFNK